MQRKQRDIESALRKKGFEENDRKHHRYFHYRTADGFLTNVYTYTSHSGTDIGDTLLGNMARQCKLPKHDFLNLVDCPMSRNAYEDRLREEGEL